ncbi:MAG: transglutaminase-like cysteine peptidase [Burkholderiaceae bacterium]|nr:transglutaminase-like cysteine peptidase [Burkholderiaceae bacterium]
MPSILRRPRQAATSWVLLAGLLLFAPTPRAWDADRMAPSAQKQGAKAVAGLRALQAVVSTSSDLDERLRLQAINEFFNRRILFRDDLEVWGEVDYWASPFELLEKGAGDCEDFAIAKYFSLVVAGMAAQKLRLVYVRALLGGPGGSVQPHMVLAYYATPNAEPLILDNLITEVRPASRRPDLTPVFSFNAEGLWQGTGAQTAGDPVTRLSRWRDVMFKARAEGFEP